MQGDMVRVQHGRQGEKDTHKEKHEMRNFCFVFEEFELATGVRSSCTEGQEHIMSWVYVV